MGQPKYNWDNIKMIIKNFDKNDIDSICLNERFSVILKSYKGIALIENIATKITDTLKKRKNLPIVYEFVNMLYQINASPFIDNNPYNYEFIFNIFNEIEDKKNSNLDNKKNLDIKNKKLDDANTKIKANENDLNKANENLTKTKKELETTKNDLKEANEKLADASIKPTNNKFKIANEELTKTKLETTINDLKEANKKLASANKKIEPTNNKLKIANEELTKTKTKLETTINDLKEANKKLASANKKIEPTNNKLKIANEELTKTKTKLETTIKDLEIANGKLTDVSIKPTNNELEKINEELIKIKTKLETKKNDLKETKKKLEKSRTPFFIVIFVLALFFIVSLIFYVNLYKNYDEIENSHKKITTKDTLYVSVFNDTTKYVEKISGLRDSIKNLTKSNKYRDKQKVPAAVKKIIEKLILNLDKKSIVALIKDDRATLKKNFIDNKFNVIFISKFKTEKLTDFAEQVIKNPKVVKYSYVIVKDGKRYYYANDTFNKSEKETKLKEGIYLDTIWVKSIEK